MNKHQALPDPPTLERWLRTATDGLPADTAAAIEREMGSHFREAIEYYVNNGLDRDPAERRALGSMIGFLVMGLGLIAFGARLWRWAGQLYGLRKPLAILMMAMGLGMATSGLWLTLRLEGILTLDAFLVVFGHLILWPILILLYYRVLYRRPLDAGYP